MDLQNSRNANNEIYGYKRARNSFEESAKKEPEEIITYLRAEARSWTNDKEPDDDVTFVVIKVKKQIISTALETPGSLIRW
ncbi:MAG: SpoIIE family protein phosphatase [Ignavibacteriaceae bacterium]|nr:SpoIIE family protein phosphatase [Ignavibacteriaceae bacterium]